MADSRRARTDPRPPLHDWGGLLSLGVWLTAFGLGILSALPMVLVTLAGGGLLWDRERRLFHAINRLWGEALMRVMPWSVELRGGERLTSGGPWIIAPNHQSVLDIVVLYRLAVQYRTIVLREWVYTPLGLNILLAGYILTRRSADRARAEQLLERCRRWLARGISVLGFPEGTRSRSRKVLRLRRGLFELAERAQVAVLPVAIAGTDDGSHPGSWRFSFRRIHVIIEILEPLEPKATASGELRAACRAALTQRVAELRAELRRDRGQGPARAR